MCRLLLTWAAATHCPGFLNGAQICCAGVLFIPVSVWIFWESLVLGDRLAGWCADVPSVLL
jgi:hypothetical protein